MTYWIPGTNNTEIIPVIINANSITFLFFIFPQIYIQLLDHLHSLCKHTLANHLA